MSKLRTNKSTIKNDPFESVIPIQAKAEVSEYRVERTPANAEVVESRVGRVPAIALPADPKPANANDSEATVKKVTAPVAIAPPHPGRAKLTVHLEGELVNRVKNAAYWNPRLTIARIAERGIRLALKEIEKENGGTYAQREADLIGGRPIK